jgi:phage gpG-like protein
MTLSSFAQLAAKLVTAEADIKLAQEAALEKACQLIEDRAKQAIGTYEFGWTPLKPKTIARKSTGDSPLLETGKLRDSIGHVVEGNVGYVGTNDPIAPYHEYGTSRIPPRPFLGGALAAAGDEIPKIFGRLVSAAIIQGGPNYHELRELLHVLKDVYHEGKDAAEDFMEDDRDKH